MMNHDRETDFVRGIYTTVSTQKALVGQNFKLLNKRALCNSSMHHSARLQAVLIGGNLGLGGDSPFKPRIPPIKLFGPMFNSVERHMPLGFWRAEMLSI